MEIMILLIVLFVGLIGILLICGLVGAFAKAGKDIKSEADRKRDRAPPLDNAD